MYSCQYQEFVEMLLILYGDAKKGYEIIIIHFMYTIFAITFHLRKIYHT
jgi:hypothetical protein